MKHFRVPLVILIFTCLACTSGVDKKIAPKAKKVTSFKPLVERDSLEKEKLSDYGFFKLPLANLEPTSQVVLYDLNTPLFSDYAFKKRFIYLPDTTKIKYKNQGVMDFDNGSVLIKNFYYPEDFRKPELEKRIIETRLLIKENDAWKPLNYIWNKEQTDARLNYVGKEEPVHWIDETGTERSVSYTVPNLNQCKNCHAKGKNITPIGPTAAQWNKTYSLALTDKNQLDYFYEKGILKEVVEPALRPKMPVWNDALLPIDHRAKAYLDGNCAHCHNLEESAKNSGLYLSYIQENSRKRGVYKPPVAAGKGSGDLIYDIVPGHPEESILIYRMKSNDPAIRMPEIGRSIAHKEGLDLLEEYIITLAQNN
jgi:uncharacterized repeat protein (TIGR03806 family)